MKAFIKALFLVPLTLFVVLFAVANRTPVRLSFDPLSQDAPVVAFDVPLFVIVLAAIAIGVLIGGSAAWLGQGRHRRAARRNRREAEQLRQESQALRTAVPDSALPALTSGR